MPLPGIERGVRARRRAAARGRAARSARARPARRRRRGARAACAHGRRAPIAHASRASRGMLVDRRRTHRADPCPRPLPSCVMRILILGGDGYLGWPTALRFSARGHEVFVVDNFSRRRWHNENSTESLTPIHPLAERIGAWHELTGNTIDVVRRQHRGRRVPRPGGRRDTSPRRSSTTASSPRRPTR